MGICLDTDQNGSQVFEENNSHGTGRWRGEAGLLSTPPGGHFPRQNIGPIKFETPKVPVIFVLGGPGSGKVTHCDNLMQEKSGITHINMMDLMQQYALGNGMQDFGQLSSRTVAEVLMLEIKLSPNAKVLLISGYPRNMRDVVEYADKIKIVNGVVLIAWREEVLERQIDFGAQLGHVIIGLARMELQNFYRNVMPVAEYFDQSGLLTEVNGERNPSEVYIDFRDAVMRILGLDDGPQDDGPRPLQAVVEVERRKESLSGREPEPVQPASSPQKPANVKPAKTADKPRKGLPSFICVIGGPGSNKSTLCSQAVRHMPGWVHVCIGSLLRTMAASNTIVNEAIMSGDMVPQDIVMQLVEQQVLLNRDTDGIILDGYPRDLSQLQEFESKFGQEPPMVLLDCSKLQLGRGRLDDSLSAFRKRLELFREVSLPMLKTLDNDSRLTIVDGDTDVPSVQQDFSAALYQLMRQARRQGEQSPSGQDAKNPNPTSPGNVNGSYASNNRRNAVPNGIGKQTTRRTQNHARSIANGVLNNANNHARQNGVARVNRNNLSNGNARGLQNGISRMVNGMLPGSNRVAPSYASSNNYDTVRKMYSEVDGTQPNVHI